MKLPVWAPFFFSNLEILLIMAFSDTLIVTKYKKQVKIGKNTSENMHFYFHVSDIFIFK